MRGSDQPHRLHRTEAQRLAPAPRELFDGQAGFEVARVVFRDMRRDACGREQRVDEALILLAIERAIQIIVGAVERFAVARRPEGDREIDRIGFDDRADGVVEEQPLGAGEPADLCGQRAAGERPGGDDRDGVVRRSIAASSRRNSMRGFSSMARETSAANTSRSTVSAWPPGTRAC